MFAQDFPIMEIWYLDDFGIMPIIERLLYRSVVNFLANDFFNVPKWNFSLNVFSVSVMLSLCAQRKYHSAQCILNIPLQLVKSNFTDSRNIKKKCFPLPFICITKKKKTQYCTASMKVFVVKV